MRHIDACEKYMSETFPVEDDHLIKIRSALERDDKAGIQIAASDARVLQFLLRLINARKMVEVGTLYGYSTLCFARALGEPGEIYSVDSSREHHEKAKALLSQTREWPRIRLITGDAKESLKGLSAHGPFDAVFIDADKTSYLEYLDWAYANVKAGGLIIGDNTFLFGALSGGGEGRKMGENQIRVMREFNSCLADSRLYNSCLIRTLEGLTVAQKLPKKPANTAPG